MGLQWTKPGKWWDGLSELGASPWLTGRTWLFLHAGELREDSECWSDTIWLVLVMLVAVFRIDCSGSMVETGISVMRLLQ